MSDLKLIQTYEKSFREILVNEMGMTECNFENYFSTIVDKLDELKKGYEEYCEDNYPELVYFVLEYTEQNKDDLKYYI